MKLTSLTFTKEPISNLYKVVIRKRFFWFVYVKLTVTSFGKIDIIERTMDALEKLNIKEKQYIKSLNKAILNDNRFMRINIKNKSKNSFNDLALFGIFFSFLTIYYAFNHNSVESHFYLLLAFICICSASIVYAINAKKP